MAHIKCNDIKGNDIKCNAVDLLGVWSSNPMSLEELKVLHSFDSITGVQCITDTEETVVAWTTGARTACQQFKQVMTEFVQREVPIADEAERMGYFAFCTSLKSFMD